MTLNHEDLMNSQIIAKLLGYELFNLSSKDKVVSIEYTEDFKVKAGSSR